MKKTLVRVFKRDESTFEFFDTTDWNGMHQEIGVDTLLDDMESIIITTVNQEVVEEDREYMVRKMQNELYEFYESKLQDWKNKSIDYVGPVDEVILERGEIIEN